MSARLSTAIKLGQASKGILRKTQSLPDVEFGDLEDMTNASILALSRCFLHYPWS